MAQLSSMRQRIRAIETIRKITNAMRLISMSTHSHLRQKKEELETYKQAFNRLSIIITHNVQASLSADSVERGNDQLLILVGSQKGLTGAFNIRLFKFFEEQRAHGAAQFSLITIGKHATDYARSIKIKPIKQYNTFSSLNFVTIAQDITQYILGHNQRFKEVIIYSNHPRTFFIQKPQATQIVPTPEYARTPDNAPSVQTEYLFEDSPESLHHMIQQLTIAVTMQSLLFESLLAEQAARFLSMDSATRNAENLLNEMKLEYNKLRQAAITRELTELASSL